MSEKKRNPRRTAAQWQAIVHQQMQSGLSGAAYCQSKGIVYQSFMNWRKKLSDHAEADQLISSPPFVELTTPDEQAIPDSSHWLVELDVGPGVQLRIAR